MDGDDWRVNAEIDFRAVSFWESYIKLYYENAQESIDKYLNWITISENYASFEEINKSRFNRYNWSVFEKLSAIYAYRKRASGSQQSVAYQLLLS